MKIIETVKEMQGIADDLRRAGKKIGFVPTMGYLHEGHLALVRKAREISDTVVVSIFVNPTQFGPTEDLDRYPRDFERDRSLLEAEKTDIIFFPDARQMYPERYATYVQVRGLEDFLCGRTRKGHFIGVATVVTKLFNIVKPHYAVFGQKDFQQLKVIERMVKDLNMDLEIIPYPTVREKDGLAMSSRNTYLNPQERERALLIHESIKKVTELFKNGIRDASILKEKAREVLLSKDGLDIEYITIADTETLEDIEIIKDKALYAVACRAGKTRLIDNTILMED
ncbi:MAG TPA: pantoate--beta-alanine ligase [Syntrophorhabdaceae bacterium]|nr:pantoate--beta-alanine ligase [Syntrophorhabdaceae bacterium]HOL06001.1 pantoate--beta-alanine ligase [Syntrophorhabdaceae bacterium]HON85412.1 pantoate--beta-alanine ligase [Syntrophorhabdaceae bacterium]HOT42272.1 pantoate--beta-alanine ligase [Syntrophorhabdaceae bacterium]HPC66989.1 pantoate--beta-alanine ligase [Syntrophorhabdaceae bacterium]